LAERPFIVRRDFAVTLLSPDNRWLDDLLSDVQVVVIREQIHIAAQFADPR
jgi:hypothetical protein